MMRKRRKRSRLLLMEAKTRNEQCLKSKCIALSPSDDGRTCVNTTNSVVKSTQVECCQGSLVHYHGLPPRSNVFDSVVCLRILLRYGVEVQYVHPRDTPLTPPHNTTLYIIYVSSQLSVSELRDHYDAKRIPAYTDRILYRSLPGFAENLQLLSFECCEGVTSSDHKPVKTSFELQTTLCT